MATIPEPPREPPPPYTPSEYPAPPPYSPGGPDKEPITTQPANTEYAAYADYGTGGTAKPTGEQYPPGAPPYSLPPPNVQPVNTSTTLLISRERKPPSFFILSLITCLCFSPLFGIIAIVFSVMSDSAWSSGDGATARRYSQVAISLSVVGILISIFTIILIFATGAVRIH